MQVTSISSTTLHNIPNNASALLEAQESTQRAMSDISVSSDSLLRGSKSVTIVHNGAIYRLQATKLGKLILTK